MRSPVLLVLFALLVPIVPTVCAKPPASDGFVRIEQLNTDLAKRFQELKQAEEFENKPLPEKLLIKWAEGDAAFEFAKKTTKLTGENIIKAVFEWDEMIGETPSEAATRVAKMLPAVLKEKYGDAKLLNTTFKRDRYKVGRELCEQLIKPPLHVRELAIECLVMTYNGGRRGYVAEDPKAKRTKKKSEWLDYVKKRAK